MAACGRLMGSGGNGVQLERPHLQTGLFGGVSHRDNRKTGNTDKDCLSCGRALDQLKAKVDWTGMPAGVRFDPSDEELLEHLSAKIGRGSATAHPLLDDFIFPLEEEDGICRTHPENLPGIKKDGSSCHYFHRPSMAYTTGTRKRRKIQSDDLLDGGADVRWHKTGKTRPVSQDGRVLGFKKIMVLYKATGKKSKNVKTNWVMHQYHLGNHEEERDGELVACKVFFQKAPRSCPGRRSGPAPLEDEDCEPSESDIGFQEPLAAGVSGDSPSVSGVTKGMPPRTPKSYTPSHPAKQLYAEPTESISEISLAQSYVPQALATQSKQKVVLVHNMMEVGPVDTCHSPSDLVPCQLLPVEDPDTPLYGGQNNMLVNGGAAENVSCEGGDESNQTVNLNDDHLSWEMLTYGEGHQTNDLVDCDPSVIQLYCSEKLNGDPLVQDEAYEDFNWRSCAYDVGCSLEDPPRGETGAGTEKQDIEVDPALNDIVLDTPPDMLEYPVVTSQEVRDWLGKQKFVVDLDNTDSQSTT